MYLPQELKLEVLSHLGYIDLKAVRLVDKLWSSCTPPFLFDKIYWSSQDLDREVFEHIVSDAALGSRVKVLEIDLSQFNHNLSKPEYFEELCSQMKTLVASERTYDNGEALASELYREIDPEILALARKVELPQTPELTDDLWKDFGNSSFVNAGYGHYMECAVEQQPLLQDQIVFKEFVTGLKCLNNLDTIVLRPHWYSSAGYTRKDCHGRGTIITALSGSPLARNWDIFHAKPSSWISEATEGTLKASEALDFLRISRALLTAAKRPRKLYVGKFPWISGEDSETAVGIAPLFCWPDSDSRAHDILAEAFRDLTHLTLRFSSFEGVGAPPVGGLGRFLASLRNLHHLDLTLPDGLEDIYSLYGCQHVFSATPWLWTHLQTFSLQNIWVETPDILQLLRRCPSLRRLSLFNIVLVGGRWEWIMEYLHKFLRLGKLVIQKSSNEGLQCGLMYPDATAYGEGGPDEYISKIQQYVTRRGPRPTLHAAEEDGMAQQYLNNLKECWYVRFRLTT